ncbi:hypothetical protein Taro_026477, partial [Colocasia esculenta]|nr:hypothetical protein [Colocasia esculenta]
VGIRLKKHKGSKNREEISHYRQKDFWKALGGSLVLSTRLSSVDTIWFSVDTLSRPGDRVHWELGLVSTLLDLVLTLLDNFFLFWLRALSIVSTPVWGVSTLPLQEMFVPEN